MIWCVEDDASIRDIEVYALNSTGFSAEGFADGAAFWAALEKDRPELVVLDVMLPEIDGIQLLRRMKADPALRDIPVIMATAKGAEYDKMVSRVKAVLRRCRPVQQQVLRCGGLAVDTKEHTVTADGVRVELTYKEFQLLRLFLSHMGTAFTRDQLMEQVWGMDFCGESRTIDMHIRTLRQKLGAYGEHIETVRSVGYRWRAQL